MTIVWWVLLGFIQVLSSSYVLIASDAEDSELGKNDWIGGTYFECPSNPKNRSIQSNKSLIRSFQLIKREGISRVHFQFEIIFLEQFNEDDEIIVSTNGVKRQIIKQNSKTQSDLCAESKFRTTTVILDYSYTRKNILLSIKSNTEKLFAIRQFHLAVNECPRNCLACEGQHCLRTFEGFSTTHSEQYCENFIYEFTCISKCPDGYYPDNLKVCQKSQLVSIKNESFSSLGPYKNKDYIQYNFTIEGQYKKLITKSKLLILNNTQLDFITQQINEEQQSFEFFQNYQKLQQNNYYEISKCNLSENCKQIEMMSYIFENKLQNQIQIMHQCPLKNQKTIYYFGGLEIFEIQQQQSTCFQQFCEVCSISDCLKCQTNYYLLNHNCVSECPKNRIALNGECQISLNFEMNIQSYFTIQQNFDFVEEFRESHYQYHDGQLSQWIYNYQPYYEVIQTQPHYAISIQFQITFQQNNGELKLKLNRDPYLIQSQEKVLTVTKTYPHNAPYFSIYISTLEQNDQELFIDYMYVVEHRCSPYCKICHGPQPTDCEQYRSDMTEFDVKTNQCQKGYYMEENNICKNCYQSCLQCTSSINCQQCKPGCPWNKLTSTCNCEKQ